MDIDRMVNNFNPNNISESDKNNKYTSYSVNKGEKIVFCVKALLLGQRMGEIFKKLLKIQNNISVTEKLFRKWSKKCHKNTPKMDPS